MHEDIKVHILKRKGRENYSMRYLDPFTNRHCERSTGTAKRKEAEKIAAKWEAELQEGRYQKRSRMTWEEFVDEHETHIISGMKASTAGAYESSLRVFKRLTNPVRLSDVTTGRMTAFATKLRKQGRSPATIAPHLRHLQVIFRWAKR